MCEVDSVELDRNFGNVKRIFLEKVDKAAKEEKDAKKRKFLLKVRERGLELFERGEDVVLQQVENK